MKLRTAFGFLLFVATLLTGCGKNERIEGRVQDLFGNPLKDVAVEIRGSGFSSKTDGSGSYSLDYAPGPLTLIFSKGAFTTHGLDLIIYQKTHFPAELVILWPIPQENGVFYIDTDNKRLVKLEANGNIISEEIQVQTKEENTPQVIHTFLGNIELRNPSVPDLSLPDYRYYVRYSKPGITIKSGEAMFMDRVRDQLSLATVKENGLIHGGNIASMDRGEGSASLVGAEQLLIRTVKLTPGSYAWFAEIQEMGGRHPKEGGASFGFQVEATADRSGR